MDISQLLQSIKTIEDRNRLYSGIELVSEAIYKEGELLKVLDSQISKNLREYIGDGTSQEVVSEKLSDLKNSLADLAVVKLTLAFEPSESTIDKIITFVRQTLSEKIILEVRFEPKILGGVILEFRGLYRDYTLKSRLDEVFKNKREELLESLSQNSNLKTQNYNLKS